MKTILYSVLIVAAAGIGLAVGFAYKELSIQRSALASSATTSAVSIRK